MKTMNVFSNSLFLLFSLGLCINPLYSSQYEIRKITPPHLDSLHLGKRILCHRPMRKGTPKMDVEMIDSGKIVAHNYGHGGSGWTLGPGCATYVIELLEHFEPASDLTKDTSITIIGAGALGFFTAYALLNKGYTDITIVAEKFENLTSHNAGGLLAPVSMDNDPQLQKIITKIGIDAYKFYGKIAKQQDPYFKDGALVVPTYFDTRENSGLEPYVGVVMQPAKDVILDFQNGKTRTMVAYDDGIFIDTAKMMAALTDYLKTRVKFIQKKVRNFDEIDDKYIVNCSGLGSLDLMKDTKLVSVQGHLIMLKDQVQEDLNYMILVYFSKAQTKHDQTALRSFYIFPKRLPDTNENDIGVIGGTFIEGATEDTPNTEEFDILLKGAKEFYGIE